jgi:hypothetical protein
MPHPGVSKIAEIARHVAARFMNPSRFLTAKRDRLMQFYLHQSTSLQQDNIDFLEDNATLHKSWLKLSPRTAGTDP